MPLQCASCRVQVCRNQVGVKTAPRYCPMATRNAPALAHTRLEVWPGAATVYLDQHCRKAQRAGGF